MSNLTYMDLSYNGLHGALPTELGRINNLEALLLRNNEWSGLLPAELAQLNANGVGQLAELSLANNSLSGTLPSQLGLHSSSLLLVDMSSNRLSGSVPPELGELTALQVLYLRSNELSGTLPPSLALGGAAGPSAIRYLEIGQNARLSGTLPAAAEGRGLTAMHTMHAHGCRRWAT